MKYKTQTESAARDFLAFHRGADTIVMDEATGLPVAAEYGVGRQSSTVFKFDGTSPFVSFQPIDDPS